MLATKNSNNLNNKNRKPCHPSFNKAKVVVKTTNPKEQYLQKDFFFFFCIHLFHVSDHPDYRWDRHCRAQLKLPSPETHQDMAPLGYYLIKY